MNGKTVKLGRMSDAAREILILKWREVRDFELPETFSKILYTLASVFKTYF